MWVRCTVDVGMYRRNVWGRWTVNDGWMCGQGVLFMTECIEGMCGEGGLLMMDEVGEGRLLNRKRCSGFEDGRDQLHWTVPREGNGREFELYVL